MKAAISFLVRKSTFGYSLEEISVALFESVQRHENSRKFNAGAFLQAPAETDSVRSMLRNIGFCLHQKGDFIHVTGDVHYLMPFLRFRRKVLTIHDAVLMTRVSRYSIRYWAYWLLWFYFPIKFSDRVIVISEKTRDELLKLVPSAASKTVCIHNFFNPLFKPDFRKINTVAPRILLVGSTPNKNIERALEAISRFPNATAVLLGHYESAIFSRLKSLGLPFENPSGLPLSEVVSVYQSCDIVLFPSLFEGFGLPIIEGQACGLPVVTSNLSPMKEVAGNGAHLVDPASVEAILEGLKMVLNNEGYRDELIRNGFENADRHRLETIASQFHDLYESLV